MTTISLCGGKKSCCPVVELDSTGAKIGEGGNLCVLKPEEWNVLVSRIKSGKLGRI